MADCIETAADGDGGMCKVESFEIERLAQKIGQQRFQEMQGDRGNKAYLPHLIRSVRERGVCVSWDRGVRLHSPPKPTIPIKNISFIK